MDKKGQGEKEEQSWQKGESLAIGKEAGGAP